MAEGTTVSKQEEQQSEGQIEEQTEEQSGPTLEEYLSDLRCGGCGHRCSLLNPRCMQGARKRSSAISEYNEMYS